MSYKTGFYEGRLGIGLDSTMGMGDGNPRYPLDINGDIRLTGSIVNGDGQVLSLVPAESLWTIGNNNLSYAGGNVGIGTQSPTELLTVGELTYDTGGTTSMSILAPGENADSILYFGTARSMDRAKKAAIIAEGTSTYSRCNLHFCLDDTADNSTTYNASLSNSRMIIKSNGNVGIGTTSPTDKLEIKDNHSQLRLTDSDDNKYAQFSFSSSMLGIRINSTSATHFFIKESGNVGIGTTSPDHKLHIDGGNTGSTTFNDVVLKLSGTSTNNNGSVGMLFNMREGASGAKSAIFSKDYAGTWNRSSLVFCTNNDTNSNDATLSDARMVIRETGNVGIGTTSPDVRLQVNSTSNCYLKISAPHASQKAISFYDTTNSIQRWVMYVPNSSDDLRLYNLSGDKITFKNNGNVGIGTTDPQQRLHVFNSSTSWNSKAIIRIGTDGTTHYGEIGYDRGASTPAHNYGEGLCFSGRDFSRKDMVILSSNGNVGIGTTNPGYKLHIVNPTLDNSIQDLLCLETHVSSQTTIGPGLLFRERWNNGSYFNLARILGMEQSGYGGQLAFFTNLGDTGADDTLLERMRIDENGNVAIGTTSPTQKLHVNGHVAIGAHDSQPTDATVLTDPNNKQNAIIFYNRYYTWAGGSSIQGAPGARTWHNFISSKYHSTDPYSGSAGYHAFLLWTYCGHHGTADVAMRMGSGNGNSKIWVNGSTTISSDRRIKTNIMDVPDDLALEMVRKIPCRYYEYKRDIYNEYDYQREKPNRTIGFIAQEVKEICPEAVDITEYKIPLDNKIYRDLDIQIDNSKNFIIIKDYSNNDLSANDEVECVINPMNNNNITQDNYKEYIDISDNQTINIKYISGCNFEILDNIDNLVFEEILLKNKKVDDFHTLDKQKLFALNFSATQELDRKVIALENENAELKAELVAIKQHLGI